MFWIMLAGGFLTLIVGYYFVVTKWEDPLDDSIQRRMKRVLKSSSSSAKR